jgi:mycothiol synthase
VSSDVRDLPALDADLAEAVQHLVHGSPAAVDSPPISERGLLHLRAGEPFGHVLAFQNGELTGYLQLEHVADHVGIELVAVDAEVAATLLAEAIARSGDQRLLLWAHGAKSVVHATAQQAGFTAVRSLFQMRRTLDTPPIPDLPPPDGVQIRPFVPGQDDEAWLAVNARAFASHPEQAGWTQADLDDRIGTTWFDPAGFLLAVRNEKVIGYHWTKVHDEGSEPFGEVYVLGVDPDAQGLKLGHVLLAAGLRHLRDRGLKTVTLYTEATNVRAVKLYGRFGFTEFTTDTQYARN